MAAGPRWVDGSRLLFVEPRLIGNLDVVSVRVADVCREVVGTPFGPKARFLEASQNLPGGTAIVDRLAEVLFILAMRTRTDTFSSTNPSWLRALTDPQISEALRQMHAAPGRLWTVIELARTVSMSRSSFADCFRELVGETPLEHLTQWRMVRAANMMCANRPMKLAAIASAVG